MSRPLNRLRKREVSVVVPVHNEAENIGPLVREICETLDGVIEYELVVVDDGSTDSSLQRLISLRKGFPRLRILHHDSCCGQSTALRTGVYASEKAWIVTLDGDGQNDPKDILHLIEASERHGQSVTPVMIAGYRRTRRDTLVKRFSSKIANRVRSRLLKDGTGDTGCGLKMFPRDMFLSLPYFDHMHRFLPALVQRGGGTVVSIDVHHRPRIYGRSHYGTLARLWTGIIDLFGVIWLQKRTRFPKIERFE